MRISTRFSDSIHILAFIETYKGKLPLSSEHIAASIETSPVVVRRLMGKLRSAGLLKTVHGSADPKLMREPKDISLYDVFLAVEDEQHLFAIDPKTNPDCIVGGNIQATLSNFYNQAEMAAKAKLATISLQDVLNSILVKQSEKDPQKLINSNLK
ncbi:Rrf2 family transcriptional regulator [Limosilactobacillus urinaemulieris]|uniref:Rrf2 family transcriptional regulator n=1 Tax=Limosilactobacillus urinaemulieris TaxID=2742600 RepID=A0ABR8ZJ66_9LACO|nr:Rrf2 family transcriptional regulator [Limosilactobacillus urinaemulieris]MBD8085311.1 Rrf2 family transcriptional regulator [Limosilactobacillus urinaemulieris]MCR5525509.1 Rrf2 family transcriptional regulator [Lactobacillus sp.]